jgi:lipid A 3-O-deacylase
MKKILLSLLLLFAVTCSFAQTHRNEFGIQTDNDSYLGQGSDRYYTDGIFFYFRRALKVNNAKDTSLQNKVLGFELGQKIFNPQTGAIPSPQYIDRPFAGYLYIGSNLNLLYKNESNLKLSAQFGVVGPASRAQSIQTWVHNNFGFYAPDGWQYQIKNDVELNLSAEYNKLLARADGADISLSAHGNLGNGFTGAGIGPLLRLGKFNQLFNSASTQSTVTANKNIVPLNKNEFFFYYKPQLNYVAYDATIQGGLFEKHNDPNSLEVTLDREPFIFSNQLGVNYSSSRWTFDVSAIFHTRDVKQMVQAHQWGSVTGIYRFD